jgi:hypothetical protein
MKKLILIAITAILLVSCGGKKRDNGAAKEGYSTMLSDSIASAQNEIDSCESAIERLNELTSKSLESFTTVANPREVGSYMIYTPFKSKYPLTGTGIIARINDTGQYELIASLSKGNFDQIEVIVGNRSLRSKIVPNDQALNYRTASLTTVSFTGAETDSIGKAIATGGGDEIIIKYLNNRSVGTWKVPAEYREMLTKTWELYESSSGANRLERRAMMLHEKIKILRQHRDGRDSI